MPSGLPWRSLNLLMLLLVATSFFLLNHGVGFDGGAKALPKFYYFNSDSPKVNFQELQQEIRNFFQSNGLQVEFQPFARLRDFHQQVTSVKPAFLLLPSWYLERPDTPKDITPLLTPIRQGRTTYTKLLMTSKSSRIDPQNLEGKTIALTTLGSEEESMLDKILFSRLGISAAKMNYIHASKDLDALIGVAINQVELALVSQESIDRLRQINPKLAEAVTALAETDPIPLPVLCYTQGKVSPEQVEAFKRVVMQGENSAGTGTLKNILQIDDWKPISQ